MRSQNRTETERRWGGQTTSCTLRGLQKFTLQRKS